MQWFSALIPAYPDIQAKAHAELDRVVGRNRLPTVEDEKNLPYIHAIIKVRASSNFPLNLLHVDQQSLSIHRRSSVATTHSGWERPT
jgi:hypothetical protein